MMRPTRVRLPGDGPGARGRTGPVAAALLFLVLLGLPTEADARGGRGGGYGGRGAAAAPARAPARRAQASSGRGAGVVRPPRPGRTAAARRYPTDPPRGYPGRRPRPIPVWTPPRQVLRVPPPIAALPPAPIPPGPVPPPGSRPPAGPPGGAAGPGGGTAPPPAGPAAASNPTSVPDEVLFRATGLASLDAVDRIAGSYGLSRVAVQPIALTGQTVYQYRITNRRSVEAVVGALRRDGRFAGVQPNQLFRLQDGNEAYFARAQYATAKLRLPEAHQMATGEGVLVAVIDSGVDDSHPELAGAIRTNLNALASAPAPDPHGTGIAGIIAAHGQLLGVAPRTRILAIRAFAAGTAGATGTTFDLLRAVSLAAEAGARVVNLSFAGPRDPLFGDVLAAAHRRGIVFVAAAGNAGAKAPPSYPAAEPSVIAVTATDAADRSFPAANRGAYVGIAAPGVDILVAAPSGAYGFSSGTSVAAAHVSGVVALLLHRNGALTPDDIRRLLVEGAQDLGPPGRDPEFGAGLVDPVRSLRAVAPTIPPVVRSGAGASVAAAAPAPPR